MKNNDGITLTSLVITVIVLLILAGISVSILLGENGLINRSQLAKEESNKQTAQEKINLKIADIQLKVQNNEQRMATLQEFADYLCEDNEIEYVELESKKVGSLNKVEVGNASSIFTKLKEYPYEFEINTLLKVASINGEKLPTGDLTTSQELIEFKKKIAAAISQEGVTTEFTDNADTMVNNIKSILKSRTADATATQEDIKQDKTAYVNGELITGNYSSNTSNICFTGAGASSGSSWTSIGYSRALLDSEVCTLSGATITFNKDCKIRMYATLFAGRRSNGTTNSAYVRVLVNNSVVYSSGAISNSVGTVTALNEYEIKSGTTMYAQVIGTDQTTKMHSIMIEII